MINNQNKYLRSGHCMQEFCMTVNILAMKVTFDNDFDIV